MPKIQSLDHLVLTVTDISRTVAFYCDGLGMEHIKFDVGDPQPRHALKFGAQKINLHRAGHEFDPKAATPTPGSADLCFLVDGEILDWERKVSAAGIPVEVGPVARSGATGQLLSIYVRDPDNNLIELSTPG